jgi:pimeloyl-ACP methyl ester carboxylesterase
LAFEAWAFMLPTITATVFLPFLQVMELPTEVVQVAPHVRPEADGKPTELKKTKDKAAFLVHGLMLHPIRPVKATLPDPHEWQQPRSNLVKNLADDFDIFSFGYAQTTPLDAVASTPGMRNGVARLKEAGYKEIVLIGHSAGGLIIRQFVERFPDAGVTKVVQVAAPNYGSDLATINVGLPKPQVSFIKSLAPTPRTLVADASEKIPEKIDFCVVVCKLWGVQTDSLVVLDSQWSKDLQKQGVPAVLVAINHFDAMKAPHAVSTIGELAREKLVRWNPEQVESCRTILFGKDADDAAVKNPRAKDRPLLRTIGKKILDR